jgi:hypothetical protein
MFYPWHDLIEFVCLDTICVPIYLKKPMCGRIEYWLTQAWSLPGMRKVFSCDMCHYLIVFVLYRIGDSFWIVVLTQCAFIHTWRVSKWNTVHFLPPSYHLVLRTGALFNIDWPRNWVDRLTDWLIELFWSSSYPEPNWLTWGRSWAHILDSDTEWDGLLSWIRYGATATCSRMGFGGL